MLLARKFYAVSNGLDGMHTEQSAIRLSEKMSVGKLHDTDAVCGEVIKGGCGVWCGNSLFRLLWMNLAYLPEFKVVKAITFSRRISSSRFWQGNTDCADTLYCTVDFVAIVMRARRKLLKWKCVVTTVWLQDTVLGTLRAMYKTNASYMYRVGATVVLYIVDFE